MADPTPIPASEVAASDAGAPSRRGAPWTEAEITQAWALERAGHTVSDIGKRLGRPTAATGQMLKRQRLLGHAMATEGQQNRAWSPEDLAAARAMKAGGQTYVQIAAHFGRTPEATRVAMMRPRSAPEAPEIPPQEVVDAGPAETGKTPDAPRPADLGRMDECAGGGEGPATAGAADAEGCEIVPALGRDGNAAGAQEQPAGHGDLGAVDVADAARDKPAPVAPAPRPTGLSMRQGWILDHLNTLPTDWSAADDLYLVEGLMTGTPAAVIADQLGRDLKTVAGRFRAMQTEEILNVRGQITLSGQQDLLAAARHRAESHV